MMEIERGHGAFSRAKIIELSGSWLGREGHPRNVVEEFFALGRNVLD